MNAIIDHQAQRLPVRRYKLGDRVESLAVGRRAAFSGTIDFLLDSGSGYNVRADDDGRLWYRTESDLTAEQFISNSSAR